MQRDKALMEKYENVVNSKKAKPIAEKDKALFEKLVDNQTKYLQEATFSGDMAKIGQILVPVYRRAFPQLIGKELVGVQPMNGPTGYMFALRYAYQGNSKAAGGTGQVTPLGGKSGVSSLDFQRSLANSAIFQFSSEAEALSNISGGAHIGPNAAAYGDAAGELASYDASAKVVYSEDNKLLVKFSSSTLATNKTDFVNQTGSNVTDHWDNEAGYKFILKGYSGPKTTADGELLGNDIEEVGLTIEKKSVEAETRKLKARYTIEAAQDLKAVHGKDMASELIDILTYELTQAIDRQIIDAIHDSVTADHTSDYKVSGSGKSGNGRWELEDFRNAYIEIVRKSNEIAKTTYRGPGNFVVAHPDVITMIENMPGYAVAPMQGDVDSSGPVNQTGNALVGTIGGRFSVYRDIFASGTNAVIGYKGASSYDTGVVYCPYVPISMKQTVDQESANPNIIFMERSAIDSSPFEPDRYYRKINFQQLF